MKTIDELATQLLEGGFFMEEAVELLEKAMITGALQRTEGNQCEASKTLGIHRNTLQRKMTEYKIAAAGANPWPEPSPVRRKLPDKGRTLLQDLFY